MSSGPGNPLAHRPFLFYLGARCFSEYSYQIATVAVGWQIYQLTGSAFNLGMVGLVQFIPSALLVFAAGHAADRYNRKRVVWICLIAEGLTNHAIASRLSVAPRTAEARMWRTSGASCRCTRVPRSRRG